MRTILFHHHLFKNAGTSVDAALKRAFGEAWAPLEAERGELAGGDLVAFLHRNPNLLSISSHTYRFPLPRIANIRFVPIMFVRHPLDRVRSAYEFERRQDADTEGARLARQHDFAGYIGARLGRPGDRSLVNFQSMKFSELRAPADGSEAEEFLSAIDTVCAIPFVGLVENYAHSMQVYSRIASAAVAPVTLEVALENVTRGVEKPLAARLAEAEAELGPDITAAFYAANTCDMCLYRLVQRLHYGPGAN